MPSTLWTIGHSKRSLDEFLALLAAFEIEVLADVRRFSGSRKQPQFNQEQLAGSLVAAGMNHWRVRSRFRRGRRAAQEKVMKCAWPGILKVFLVL